MFFVNHFMEKIILNFSHFFVDMKGQKRYYTSCVQEWRNWQTRRLQVPVAAMSCGFKSHLLHFSCRNARYENPRKPSKIKACGGFYVKMYAYYSSSNSL